MSPFMQPAIPILRSFDEDATRAFYLGFLGFEVAFEHRLDADAPLYIKVRREACVIHLSEHYGDAALGAALRIAVKDVHGFCRELNDKSFKYARPAVQRQDWGEDEMIIRDPSGNRLVFSTPVMMP